MLSSASISRPGILKAQETKDEARETRVEGGSDELRRKENGVCWSNIRERSRDRDDNIHLAHHSAHDNGWT